MMTDENVRRLEQIHSTETAAAAAATAAAPHLDVTPVSRDDDQVKTNTPVAGDSGQPGVSSWTCDDVTRWLADNQLLSLKNWYIIIIIVVVTIIITSGQINLSSGCIAAAHERFSRIRQVAPMCTPSRHPHRTGAARC